MLYPELFRALEEVRWNLADDIPWDAFDGALLSDEQARTVKMNAITEWAALPATEMFLRDNRHDSDFSAFLSIWFYEEQKHSLVLIEYLRRFRPELVPTEAELHAVRFEFDPAPPLETLMLHFCGEIRLNHWYRRARRMARRARDPADLRADRAGRGAPRRRVPPVHEARHRALGRRGEARVYPDRRADGELRGAPASPCIRRTCTSRVRISPTIPCRAACPIRRGSSAGSTGRSGSTANGNSA